MSDNSNIKNSDKNEDIVDELVEAYTMVPSRDDEVEPIKNEAEDTEVQEVFEKKPSFFASCAATVSDAIIIAVLAYALMYIVDFILRNTVGLYIIEKNQMLFLLYVIVSLLYVSILESTLGFTVGKTVFGIKVTRI